MKRKFLLIFLSIVTVVCLAFGLAACDSNSNGENSSSGSTESSATNTDRTDSSEAESNNTETDGNGSTPDDEENKTADSNELEYTLSDDGTYYTVSGYNTQSSAVTIPSAYNNIPVTKIGDYVFVNSTIESITIPESIISIGAKAFSNCTQLDNVYYSGTASGWASISFADYNSNPFNYANSFYINGKLATDITLENITSINDYAFYHLNSLASVIISDDVVNIGEKAFYYCQSITTLTVGKGVAYIGESAFDDCTMLSEIYFNATAANDLNSSAFYHAGRYCEKSTLYIGANVTEIPTYLFNSATITDIVFEDGSECKSIGDHAFLLCSSLTSISLPDQLTYIGASAFYDCTKLTSVIIPASVTTINGSSYDCTSLTDIYYGGTASQWASISFGGYIFDSYNTNNLNLYFQETLATDIVLENISAVNAYAFYGCNSIKSVTLGDSITSIGDYAFCDCYRLVEIYNLSSLALTAGGKDNGYIAYYAKNVYDSANGSHILTSGGYSFIYDSDNNYYLTAYNGTETDLTLPANINGNSYSIADYAFYNCATLTSVTIPEGVTTIGDYAFYNCTSLTSVTIPDSVTLIGDCVFTCCLSIKNITVSSGNTNYKSVDGNLYSCDGTDLIQYAIGKTDASFTVPDCVSCIGEYAFYNCTSLATVIISDDVYKIDNCAFTDCYSLISITIGSNVNYINNAFRGCYKLVEVCNLSQLDITAGSRDNGFVAYYAINVCTSRGPEILTYDGDYVFYNSNSRYYLIGYTGTETDITLPDGINGNNYSIADYAFYYCTSLTNVTIPESVTSIGEYSFYNCISITSITIPDSVTSIGYYAFFNCTSLTNVTIGSGVKSMWVLTFGYCNSLTSIVIPDSVTYMDTFVFRYCSSITNIYYTGNADGWSKISTDNSNYTYFNKATIYYYSESQPAESGNYWHYVNGEIVVWS